MTRNDFGGLRVRRRVGRVKGELRRSSGARVPNEESQFSVTLHVRVDTEQNPPHRIFSLGAGVQWAVGSAKCYSSACAVSPIVVVVCESSPMSYTTQAARKRTEKALPPGHVWRPRDSQVQGRAGQ
jgi:hypothetical protein